MREQNSPESRLCPVCGSAARETYLSKATLELVRCPLCTMIFVPEGGTEFTGGEFYQTTASTFYASDEKIAGDYSPVRYEREIRILRRFCRTGRVLDVGCSTGGFLYYLRERFPGEYQVTGNDVATGALELAASKGLAVIRESFFSFEIPAEPFDAITFWAVLEHVAEPGRFLGRAYDLIAPGGWCVVLVPNVQSLAIKVLGAKYRYILPQHLNYFSARTLSRLVASRGFEIVHATTTHFNPVVIFQDLRRKHGFVPDQERARLLVKTNSLKANPLLWPVRAAYTVCERLLGFAGLADNLVVVARKPRVNSGARASDNPKCGDADVTTGSSAEMR